MQVDVVADLRQRGVLMSAHEVLDHVRDGSQRLAPPTIHRTLAALVERGGVHRLESLEAFDACGCERRRHVPIFQIQEECAVLEEAVSPHVPDELSMIVGQSGFAPARQVVGVHGPRACCGSDEAPA